MQSSGPGESEENDSARTQESTRTSSDSSRQSSRSDSGPSRSGTDSSQSGSDRDSEKQESSQEEKQSQSDQEHRQSEDERVDIEQQRSFLIDCLDDAEQAKQRLPYVVRLLETDEKPIRVLAATTCCLIAVETDDTDLIEYLVRRLSDRLGEGEVSLELTTALDYLSSEYSEYVSTLLAELAEEDDQDVPLPEVGNFTRNYYYGHDPTREGVGRTRIAGEGVEDDPTMTVADRQQEEREKFEYEQHREIDPDEEDEDEIPDVEDSDEDGGTNPEAMIRRTKDASSIAVRSRFDELYVQGERRSGRFSTTYESLVGQGGEQRAVGLRLVHQPEKTADVPAFQKELRGYLKRWQAVGEHDHIVTVLDWGIEPRPWIATSLARERLSDREYIDFRTALGNAMDLVDALSSAHQNDVIHGGLDAQNVVFPEGAFEDVTEQAPLLDNVGLMQVFRHYFAPADCLDPRYAAPEYYTNRFGRIDHATDIYQLGAIFYRLFTGQPPHTGDFDSIRGSILTSHPTPPSDIVDDVPEEIDNLITKAMARQKLRRYETVEHLHQELASIAAEYEYV
jgi:hypothetical protein